MNPSEIVLATANSHKVAELQSMLADSSLRVISAREAGFIAEIEETGATLEENALLKARIVARFTKLPVLADDTGLEVDVLGGGPGVFSARFAGLQCTPAENRLLLLTLMEGVPWENRTARFRCVLAFVNGDQENMFEGVISGHITSDERGIGGFGYDAIFVPEGNNRTFAELSAEEKNRISHRAEAMQAFTAFVRKLN